MIFLIFFYSNKIKVDYLCMYVDYTWKIKYDTYQRIIWFVIIHNKLAEQLSL